MDTPSRLMTAVRHDGMDMLNWQSFITCCSRVKTQHRFSPKLQSLLQQINPFGSMRSDSNFFKRAFGDTQIPS